jgi:hypothetical protein
VIPFFKRYVQRFKSSRPYHDFLYISISYIQTWEDSINVNKAELTIALLYVFYGVKGWNFIKAINSTFSTKSSISIIAKIV